MKQFHVYHFGIKVASTIDPTVAAAIAGMTSEGVVKYGRREVYNDETDDHIAGESWDQAAELIYSRIAHEETK